jgi:hypothetical protein
LRRHREIYSPQRHSATHTRRALDQENPAVSYIDLEVDGTVSIVRQLVALACGGAP